MEVVVFMRTKRMRYVCFCKLTVYRTVSIAQGLRIFASLFIDACLLQSFYRCGSDGIFSIFAKMTQQSIDRMNQIKTIPKLEDISG